MGVNIKFPDKMICECGHCLKDHYEAMGKEKSIICRATRECPCTEFEIMKPQNPFSVLLNCAYVPPLIEVENTVTQRSLFVKDEEELDKLYYAIENFRNGHRGE